MYLRLGGAGNPTARARIAPGLDKQKPGVGPGFTCRVALQNRESEAPIGSGQATFANALLMPLLIGSAVSVATFWASAFNSLVCWVSASNCLRACVLDSSTISERVLAAISSPAKSNAALVLTRAASIILRPYSDAPLLAVE